MRRDREQDRRIAIDRHLGGESPIAIWTSLVYSKQWFYKWLRRYREGRADWFQNRSCRPQRQPRRTDNQVEQTVLAVRERLLVEGAFFGAQAIRWELEDLGVAVPPSIRTIGRILARNDQVVRRQRRYEPKGKKYPALTAGFAGDVHQSDFVGPCYLQGSVRFYSLNSVDLATRRCAVEPMTGKGAQASINGFWASWKRLGIPRHQQVDNESVFLGSPRHPRGMGSLIRLCLLHGIEVWFIPPAEPWRNSVVEKFNDHWRYKFLRRVLMDSVSRLHKESLHFEDRHNRTYRYSALGGKTPLATLGRHRRLRFPSREEPPVHPLPKPEKGRYHLIRFVRSDGFLDLFGEKFLVPPTAIYEYLRATIDVGSQRLNLFLGSTKIEERPYRLR
ncbi:MAG: transposase [bacterium]|nr:transposase [bacterium]